MADKYNDSNGEYAGDFKRRTQMEKDGGGIVAVGGGGVDGSEVDNDESNPAMMKASEYISELLQEKLAIDSLKYPNTIRLIDQEIAKVQAIGKVPAKDLKYVDIYRERPMKVSVKVLVPVKEHPKFNFVGKLLGPKGNSMKRLQEETMCKMAVLGRGSMKDRNKEEELRQSCDSKYAHLSDDLHVEISALGPPAEAHARVAFALAEVRKYLIPDNNDNIRQEQMREMEIMTAIPNERESTRRTSILRSSSRSARGSPFNGLPAVSASVPRAPLQMRTATRTPVVTPRVMPAKTKILSILDRARIAMEESYGYEEPYEPTEPSYEHYSPPPSHYRSGTSSHHYDTPEYDTEYYRESSSSYGKNLLIISYNQHTST